jgi:hypothetical protein
MNWGIYQPRVRFDVRVERDECQRLFMHPARVLQDRLVRRSRTDRTKQYALTEWEKLEDAETKARQLLYQARVLGWGKEKRYYYSQLPAAR